MSSRAAFIFAKLQETGLHPSAAADRRTLIRRVYYDLIGLPPSVDTIESFLKIASPDAFCKGRRSSARIAAIWGRYWLNLARYADAKG
jgi:hypothetical protein